MKGEDDQSWFEASFSTWPFLFGQLASLRLWVAMMKMKTRKRRKSVEIRSCVLFFQKGVGCCDL